MDSRLYEFIHAMYIEHSKKLFQRAYHVLGDSEKAQELMQEAFVIASNKAQQLQDHPNPAGWLHITLSNLMYKQLRKGFICDYPFGDDIDLFPDEMERANLMHILPDTLSEDERCIMVLFYEYRYSYQEIANILCISMSACGMRLQRAKQHYREILESEQTI